MLHLFQKARERLFCFELSGERAPRQSDGERADQKKKEHVESAQNVERKETGVLGVAGMAAVAGTGLFSVGHKLPQNWRGCRVY